MTKPTCAGLVRSCSNPGNVLAFSNDDYSGHYLLFTLCDACREGICPDDALSRLPTDTVPMLEVPWRLTAIHRLMSSQLVWLERDPAWLIDAIEQLVGQGHDLPQASLILTVLRGGSGTMH